MNDRPPPEKPPVTEATLDASLRAVWPGLTAYVASMLGPHRHHADDVLQETALWVWDHRSELPEIRNFDAWVFRSAYFKTRALRRDLARSREALIGDELFERIAGAAEESSEATSLRLDALRACIASMPSGDRRIVDVHYRDRRPLTEIAPLLRMTAGALHQRVSRLRRSLRHCVEHRLAAQPA